MYSMIYDYVGICDQGVVTGIKVKVSRYTPWRRMAGEEV
jgi:hypothetical protein